MLSQNRTTNIVFDWDKMLSFEGNSAPYLQYSYARASSILRKSSNINELDIGDLKEDKAKSDEKIRSLISIFPKYAESLNLTAREYRPNILCNYLYELAQKFNTFYNSVPVIKVADLSERKYRLDIVRAAAAILKSGLSLLGVEVVEEM